MPLVINDTFIEALTNFWRERAYTEDELQKNQEYTQLDKNFSNFINCIKANSNDTALLDKLSNDCSDIKDQLVALAIESGYKQGFSEGMKLILYSVAMV